jgi:hypothetical protein
MPRRPDAWLSQAADPEGAELERALEGLVERLEHARGAAQRAAGRTPLGLREVEFAPGTRHYLCAFEGPAFICLADAGSPVTDVHVVHRVATVGLVWEQLEADVDPSRLGDVAAAAARVLAATDAPVQMVEAVAETAEHAVAISAWRESPLRAVASLAQVDVLFALQERGHRAYSRFIQGSEPLVARQDELSQDLVAALGGFERASIAAGLGARLADRLGAVVSSCDQAAGEIVAAHLTPLDAQEPVR